MPVGGKVTIIADGIEISIAGGIVGMVGANSEVAFCIFFFFFFFFYLKLVY